MKNIFQSFNSIKKLTLWGLGGLLLCFTSCGEEVVNEYSSGQCYLYYNGLTTPLTSLNAAITGSNTFCKLWMQGGTNTYYILRGQLYGQKADSVIVNSQSTLQNNNIALGKDNNKGLIIGRSSMQDGGLYVYDRVCPNCFTSTRTTKNTVSFDSSNSNNVTCSGCKRSYSLLNGGVVVSGDNGDKLYRYKAYNTGTTLNIQNP